MSAQDIYSLDPWKLPRIALENKKLLPDGSGGLYFVFQHHNLLYIGKTDRSFKKRWASGSGNHHRERQFLQMDDISIACWERQEREKKLLELEDTARSIFRPLLNGTSVVRNPSTSEKLPVVLAEMLLIRQERLRMQDEAFAQLHDPKRPFAVADWSVLCPEVFTPEEISTGVINHSVDKTYT